MLRNRADMLLRNLELKDVNLTSNQPAPVPSIPPLVQPKQFPDVPYFWYPSNPIECLFHPVSMAGPESSNQAAESVGAAAFTTPWITIQVQVVFTPI